MKSERRKVCAKTTDALDILIILSMLGLDDIDPENVALIWSHRNPLQTIQLDMPNMRVKFYKGPFIRIDFKTNFHPDLDFISKNKYFMSYKHGQINDFYMLYFKYPETI